MKGPASLQRELLVGLTLGMAVLWLVATLLSGLVVRQKLDQVFDNAMQETAQRLFPLAVVDILNRDDSVTPQRVAPLNTQREGFNYQVRDQAGVVLLQSQGADASVFDIEFTQGFSSTSTHRLYGAGALQNTLLLQIAEPLAHRREAAWNAIVALLLPLLLLIPLSLLGVWLLVRLSLRGIAAYRQALETRGPGNLSPIHQEQLPTEILPIADAVNHLIERLQNALEAERRFAANSAHELRTPLAAALAHTQRLYKEAPEGPLRIRATQVESSLNELSRLTEKLLQLAKAEGGGLWSDVPHDLALVLEHVVQDIQRSSEVSIELSLPVTGPVWSFVDPDAFAILARNLLENAIKHGSQTIPIETRLTGNARLTVVNGGAVVPQARLKSSLQEFVRGDTRAKGYGLGLAIVAMIAKGVSAKLTLASPATGRVDGFEATVQFPAAQGLSVDGS